MSLLFRFQRSIPLFPLTSIGNEALLTWSVTLKYVRSAIKQDKPNVEQFDDTAVC